MRVPVDGVGLGGFLIPRLWHHGTARDCDVRIGTTAHGEHLLSSVTDSRPCNTHTPGIHGIPGAHSPVTASTRTHATRLRDHEAARPCSPILFAGVLASSCATSVWLGPVFLMLLILVSDCATLSPSWWKCLELAAEYYPDHLSLAPRLRRLGPARRDSLLVLLAATRSWSGSPRLAPWSAVCSTLVACLFAPALHHLSCATCYTVRLAPRRVPCRATLVSQWIAVGAWR